MRDMLILLNLDPSVARLTARKLRSEKICCRILPADTGRDALIREDPCGLVLCAAMDTPIPALDPFVFSGNIPLLALGSAAALLNLRSGGTASALSPGKKLCEIRCVQSPLFEKTAVFTHMISGTLAVRVPEHFEVLATLGQECLPFAFSFPARHQFGTFLEPEPHDPDSTKMLSRFAFSVCGCTPWWNEDALVGNSVSSLRSLAGDGSALCMMTGGLHACVAAMLAGRALGDRLTCCFVNTGLLQEGEEARFTSFFRSTLRLNVVFLNEEKRFLEALKGLRSQEDKRSAIHSLMRVVAREIQRDIPNLSLVILDQAYTDAPRREPVSLRPGVQAAQPLADLFLDEVRQVGAYLGLPYEMIAGQLIPDTGLALNIVGEVTEERLSILRFADAVFRRKVRHSGQSLRLSEYYAVLRPYEKDTYSVILRALSSTYGDELRAARTPYDVLEEVAEEIRSACPQVRRVLYDLTPSSRA